MNIKYILFWAILFRFLIMPFFFHPDLKDHHQRANYLYTQGVLNIYEFLRQDSYTKEHNLDFSYPPVTYFTLGIYQYLISPILGNDFQKWTRDYSDYRYNTLFIFRYLFSLKFIYLIFELSTGLLIYKLLTNSKKRIQTLAFWFFNPINLYAISAIGQFDIIPTFFTIFSLFLWNRKKILFSGLSLGLSIAFKTYPLLFLPFFLLSEEKLKNKIIFLLASLGIYGTTILPFINSKAFQNDVLFSGLSTRIFQLKVSISDQQFSVFIVLYLLIIATYWFLRSRIPLYIFFAVILTLVFSVTRSHPQWIIWLMPFFTLAYGENRINLKYLSIFIIFYFIYFIFFGDSFLTTGLLSPISTIYLEIPSFTELIPDNYRNLISIFTQSLFAFVLSIISMKLLLRRNKQL